jgi:DNA polymerase-3 subunit delta
MTQPADPIPQADVYILQGDDEFSTKDYLKALAALIRAESAADLDVVSMDGHSTDRTMFAQTLNSLSLFSPARLVILEGALDTLRGKEDAVWLAETLKQLPQNTRLALVIPDSRRFSKGEWLWEKVGKGHWLRASLTDSGKKTEWVEKMLPKQAEMAGWIMDEARRQAGGDKERFEGRAAAELANLVGNNLYQVRQEIAKALDYVGPEGTVTREDVRLLCSQSREEDIFEMVDMVGARNAQKALSLLERLLQDLPAQYIFSMLARQVRLLIMAREVLDERGDDKDLAARTHMHAFVAKKTMAQCRHFSIEELEALYRRLDRMDEDAKTGNATLEVAMESLIAELARK